MCFLEQVFDVLTSADITQDSPIFAALFHPERIPAPAFAKLLRHVDPHVASRPLLNSVFRQSQMYEGPNHWCLGQANPCSLSSLNADATSFYLHQLSFCLCKRPESQGGVTAPCLAWVQCVCQFCKCKCWRTAHDSIV